MPGSSVTVLLAVMVLKACSVVFAFTSSVGTLIVPPLRMSVEPRVNVPAVAERVQFGPSVCVPASKVLRMLVVMVGAVAKFTVPLDQLKVAPVVRFTVLKFRVPPSMFTLAFVRKFVVPFRFIVEPVPTFSVADAAGSVAEEPPMLAVPAVV